MLKSSLGLLLFLTSATISGYACSCIDVGPPCQAALRKEVSAVFAGKVTEIVAVTPATHGALEFPENLVTFDVISGLKNVSSTTLDIRTAQGEAACGFPFKVGDSYVVYAYESQGKLYTSICSRTRELQYAEEDIKFFLGLASAPPTGRIYGTAKRYTFDRKFVPKFQPSIMDHYRPPEEEYEAMAPLAGQKVTVQGEGTSRSTTVDERGNYEFAGLTPGKYKVSITLPSNLRSTGTNTATVVEKGCAQVDFRTQSDGLIAGRAIDASGAPLSHIFLYLIYSDRGDGAEKQDFDAFTNENGEFSFEGIPPAKYLLGINVTKTLYWLNHELYPKLYYPGFATASGAEVIRLGDGQKVTGLTFVIPKLNR